MKWTSALAIFTLFWVFSAFFVLPFHGRRSGDEAPQVAGQDHGAPAVFRPKRILAQMTISATLCFVIYYIAYVNGWADPDVLSGRA